jgi:cytosine/adenosine deaminase-related metal-dependent hydrolase
MTRTFTARWVFPVSSPPIEGGSVTVAGGRFTSVGQGDGEDLGDVALIPGLVNAHCHLDLTGLAGKAPPSRDFTGWLLRVIGHRRGSRPEQVDADIRNGISQSLAAGTTLIGDISGDGASAAALAQSPLASVCFREVIGLSPERAQAAEQAMAAWPGAVSPHAPYSCGVNVFRAAASKHRPVCTHLAETVDELELLTHRRGPFVPFLQSLGAWFPDHLAESVELVLQLLDTSAPVLLAHGNYFTPRPLPPNVTVVYCPRTHAAFGHSPHPAPGFLRLGVRVALGTDSLASNPDLSILEEMRFLHSRGALPPEAILRAATLAGAEALGMADRMGSLEVGKRADLVAVPLGPGQGPWERLLTGTGTPSRVMIVGDWVA